MASSASPISADSSLLIASLLMNTALADINRHFARWSLIACIDRF